MEITKTSVMEVAKISGLATYHKCMRELVEFIYIQYDLSCNPAINSQVRLLKVYDRNVSVEQYPLNNIISQALVLVF